MFVDFTELTKLFDIKNNQDDNVYVFLYLTAMNISSYSGVLTASYLPDHEHLLHIFLLIYIFYVCLIFHFRYIELDLKQC